jgi:hypothetical protein
MLFVQLHQQLVLKYLQHFLKLHFGYYGLIQHVIHFFIHLFKKNIEELMRNYLNLVLNDRFSFIKTVSFSF